MGGAMNKWERYWQLSGVEERFNASSAGIRALASAWLLASLGAIGFLLGAGEQYGGTLSIGLLLVTIATLGCIGITTLLVMDEVVFRRLLNAVFLVGIRMEHADPELPPIRCLMIKLQEGLGTHRWEKLFYIAPLLFYSFFSAVVIISAVGFSVNDTLIGFNARTLSIALLCLQLIVLAWVFWRMPTAFPSDGPTYFDDPDLEQMFSDKSFEQVIARYRPSENAEPASYKK